MKLKINIQKIKCINDLTIELPIDKGIYAITGQNGSGKSTIAAGASSVFFRLPMKEYFGKTDDDALKYHDFREYLKGGARRQDKQVKSKVWYLLDGEDEADTDYVVNAFFNMFPELDEGTHWYYDDDDFEIDLFEGIDLAVFRNDASLVQNALLGYEWLLEEWKEEYAPTFPDDEWCSRYTHACQMLPIVKFLLDYLAVATFKERYALVENLMEDDTIPKLRKFAGKELGKKYGRIAKRESEPEHT